MGEVCCFDCMRFLVLFLNVLFWMMGMIIITLGIVTIVDPTSYIHDFLLNHVLLPKESEGPLIQWLSKDFEVELTLLAYVLIAVGGITLLLSFLGCAGAYRHSQCLLGTYVFLLVMIILLEVAGAVLFYLQGRERLSQVVHSYMIKEYDDHKNQVDMLQRNYRCCGANGPTDWAVSNDLILTRSNTVSGWNSCVKKGSLGQHGPGCLDVFLSKDSRGFRVVVSSFLTLFSLEIICVFMAIGVCCVLFNSVEDLE